MTRGGHEEGDRLLVNAAALLKKHFADDEIYRSGGDEFVVIVSGCTKEDFEKRVQALKKESSYGNTVSFAVGSFWSDRSEKLRECMHKADEAMYEDKKEFYRQHPEKAR